MPNTTFCIKNSNEHLILARKQTELQAQIKCSPKNSNNGEVTCSGKKANYSKWLETRALKNMRRIVVGNLSSILSMVLITTTMLFNASLVWVCKSKCLSIFTPRYSPWFQFVFFNEPTAIFSEFCRRSHSYEKIRWIVFYCRSNSTNKNVLLQFYYNFIWIFFISLWLQ